MVSTDEPPLSTSKDAGEPITAGKRTLQEKTPKSTSCGDEEVMKRNGSNMLENEAVELTLVNAS